MAQQTCTISRASASLILQLGDRLQGAGLADLVVELELLGILVEDGDDFLGALNTTDRNSTSGNCAKPIIFVFLGPDHAVRRWP